MEKRYLGDGVYVEVENGMLKLTVEDGLTVTETIYLEDSVLSALNNYYADAVEHFAHQARLKDAMNQASVD